MARALKILGLVLLALVILLMTAVFIITRVIDPNDFKPQISEIAREQANLDLSIPGQLAWTFWPSLGVSSGRVEVRLADEEALFAALDSAAISVAVWPLLMGQVQMDGLALSGMEANLLETAAGGNWERIGAAAAEPTSEESASETDAAGGLTVPVTIPSLSITNSRLRYASELDGTDIRIEKFNLNATDVSLSEPFPLTLSLRYQDQADIRLDMKADATVGLNLDAERYSVDDLKLELEVAGVTTSPVVVSLRANLLADLAADSVSVEPLTLTAAGATIKGHVSVAQMSGKPILTGSLSSNRFDANKLLAAIGESTIDTANPAALSAVGFDLTLAGPENTVVADPMTLYLDESTITGRAGIMDLDSSALMFDLTLDELRVDDYLPPSAAEDPADTTAAAPGGAAPLLPPLSTEPLLPLEDLRTLIVNGKFRAGKIDYDTLTVSALAMDVSASNGLFRLSRLTGNSLGGSFTASGALDAKSDTPVMEATLTSSTMQIQPVMMMALEDDLFTGILDTSAKFTASGNTEKALANSFAGTMDISLAKGTIRGINLYNTLLSGINELLGAYEVLTTLIPGQQSGKLPAELSKDTEVVQLSARARVEKLVAHVDSLSAELDKGTLSGSGTLDLRREDFDFRFGMKSPAITDNKYLKDQTWPMRCEGNLAGSPADWCGHDKAGFREIGKKVAAQAAKDKIKDKLGLDAQGDTPKEVLKNAAEEKAKEEVNKKLEDGLKKLFR